MDQSDLVKALATQNDNLAKLTDQNTELKARVLDLEQKGAHKPGIFSDEGPGELVDLITKSEALQAFVKGNSQVAQIQVPHRLVKAAIIGGSTQNQPLFAADRRPGIVAAPQRRFTMRNILESVPTNSGLIEYARETTFTNNAGPQYDGTSPSSGTEGAVKPESSMGFELATAPVITIAHWIPASRQILSDAPMLRNYIDNRLLYGLGYEEEDEILNGAGTSGELNGLMNNATAFTGGGTNQSAIDTLAKAMSQLIAGEYTPTAIVLNPADWFAIILLKDTQGRYLFGDPQTMTEPRLWGLPVVATNAMTAGQFLVLDGPRVGYIVDREDATVRVSEHHADFFVRNLVALLAEERVGLVITKAAAMVKGEILTPG